MRMQCAIPLLLRQRWVLCTPRSDKLAKWCLLGVQGALLSTVLEEPLYLQTLTVAIPPSKGSLAEAAAAALQRAVAGETSWDVAPCAFCCCEVVLLTQRSCMGKMLTLSHAVGRTEAASGVLPAPFRRTLPELHLIALPQCPPSELLRPSTERTIPSGISGSVRQHPLHPVGSAC